LRHKIQSLPELLASSRSVSDSQRRSTVGISTTKVEIKNETSKNQWKKNLQIYTSNKFRQQNPESLESTIAEPKIYILKFRGAKQYASFSSRKSRKHVGFRRYVLK
jgi:hypothetical protein